MASVTTSYLVYCYLRKLRFLRKVRIRIIRTIRKLRTYFSIVTISHNQWLKEYAPPSTDFPQTYSQTVPNVRRNPFSAPFSLKINAPFLITQHGGTDTCGGMAEKFPPLPPLSPHVIFIFRVRFLRFSVFSFQRFRVRGTSLNSLEKSINCNGIYSIR